MLIKKGEIIEGKITGITKYGAFVSVNSEISGMIHISEIAFDFIKDINEVLELNQTVKAAVIGVNENGKLALSIKQLPKDPAATEIQGSEESDEIEEPIEIETEAAEVKDRVEKTSFKNPEEFFKTDKNPGTSRNFEDMMNKFKRDSDEKMSDLKFLEQKRTGLPRRRKDEKN